jgi:hypothetical protein
VAFIFLGQKPIYSVVGKRGIYRWFGPKRRGRYVIEEGEALPLDFLIGGFSPPEGRLARGFKPPAFSRFLFQSAVQSAESF